jgi:hypothetical protein
VAVPVPARPVPRPALVGLDGGRLGRPTPQPVPQPAAQPAQQPAAQTRRAAGA